MSKFDNGLETGYQRVADVIKDFVVGAAEGVESKKPQRSISANG